jgi:transposase
VVRPGLKNRDIGAMESIGIDEITYRREHEYLTLVYQIDEICRR